MTLTYVCEYLRNWFDRGMPRLYGVFKIEEGRISMISSDGFDLLLDGQYIRIMGSVFNDGVWKLSDHIDGLTDETFTGDVIGMAVPQEVLSIVDEMTEWEAKNKDAMDRPYQSESFGGYSYSKNGNGAWGSIDRAVLEIPSGARLLRYKKL